MHPARDRVVRVSHWIGDSCTPGVQIYYPKKPAKYIDRHREYYNQVDSVPVKAKAECQLNQESV